MLGAEASPSADAADLEAEKPESLNADALVTGPVLPGAPSPHTQAGPHTLWEAVAGSEGCCWGVCACLHPGWQMFAPAAGVGGAACNPGTF